MRALRFVCLALVLVSLTAAAQVPTAAAQYRADLTRAARATWGLDAPIATFAGQLHQESGWRPGAVSYVGAQGMAQFMPSTADWIARAYPALADKQPFNPGWSLRALVTYDQHLWQRVKATTSCDRMAKALSAYNGGLGWVYRDEATAHRAGRDMQRWFGAVEAVNAGRSDANWRENRAYPRRILRTLEPIYVRAGWGNGSCT
ncbi:lytic transglycosylase domain-containing protein [Burkholderia cepacia]|uniref:transglycosylase SLT domain-containing protein n=1 Tax=Burkholderia cepacia TaxID=292 RepID=UPI0026DFB185|nr:lytic transglycosylase domain-containing protein [Burkholderia cepacia]MDO5940623.1 lytic transglycosylase domain-containing protein [Burkholderia cepacia]